MSRWPGGNGHHSGRWPGRRPSPSPVEPPAWFRVFVAEDWAEPGDDEVRYQGGALMGGVEVAERRWLEACRQWARDNGMSIADWLTARRAARRAAMGWDDPPK